MTNTVRGVQISAGDGIVAHFGGLTAYAVGETGRLNELLVRLSALADSSWQDTVRTITAGISEAGYDDHPSIACVSMETHKLGVFVYGPLELTATIGGGTTVLDGRDSSTWIDVVLRGDVEQVHAGSRAESSLVGVLRDGVVPAGGFLIKTSGPMPSTAQWDAAMGSIAASDGAAMANTSDETTTDETTTDETTTDETSTDENASTTPGEVQPNDADNTDDPAESDSTMVGVFTRIEQLSRETVLTAAGMSDTPEPAPTVDATTADAATNDDTATNDTPTATTTAAPQEDADADRSNAQQPAGATTATLRKPRPELRGVHCPNGHFTPLEQTCRTCSVELDSNVTLTLATRPVLGHLVFDDGAVLNIDRPAVVGSDVPTEYTVNDEPTTIVRLDDGHGGVSPVQLEVRPSGWSVEIVDMASANGTYTMLRDERQSRTRLRSGQAVTLQDGMTVESGTRTFKFGIGPHNG